MSCKSVTDFIFRDAFVELNNLIPAERVVLKLEGQSLSGSIKVKSALALIEAAEKMQLATPGKSTFIESSSGNLGVAMAAICAAKGYHFICVSDPCAAKSNVRAIRAYGGEVVIVRHRDANGGYVGTRIEAIKALCDQDPNIIWMNQYQNRSNPDIHANETAYEILNHMQKVDWLVIGVGTGGTFMGCAETFGKRSPSTRLVAVDPVGSVTFGRQPGRRLIPGIGNSCIPPIFDPNRPDFVVEVDEPTTINTCRWLAKEYGLLLGGSSGSAVAAAIALAPKIKRHETVAIIAPDMGDKYLDTIFDNDWVNEHFGDLKSTTSPTVFQHAIEA